jgi:uncharacterized protein
MQELPSLTVNLLPRLAELGNSMQLTGAWPLGEYRCGSAHFRLRDDVAYDLQLSNTGGGVLLTGTVRAKAQTSCARCLEPACLSIDGTVEGYFLLDPSDDELDLADDEFVVVGADGVVDLAAALYAALVFETPQVVLCADDCQGLCPVCGADLNVQGCDCAHGSKADNPFSVLKELDLQGGAN